MASAVSAARTAKPSIAVLANDGTINFALFNGLIPVFGSVDAATGKYIYSLNNVVTVGPRYQLDDLPYRLLAVVSNRPFTEQTRNNLEMAMSEIQLLGSRRIVELSDRWVEGYARGEKGITSPLATALRDELRAELNLEKLDRPPKVLRIELDEERQA